MNTQFLAAAQAIAAHFRQSEVKRGEAFPATFKNAMNDDAVTPNKAGIPVSLLRALVEAEALPDSPGVNIAALARIVRGRGETLLDMSREMHPASARLLRDNAELACVVARVLEGKDVLRALGAPGDWGYDQPIGKALLRVLNEPAGATTQGAQR